MARGITALIFMFAIPAILLFLYSCVDERPQEKHPLEPMAKKLQQKYNSNAIIVDPSNKQAEDTP